jgi:hypothetical protein
MSTSGGVQKSLGWVVELLIIRYEPPAAYVMPLISLIVH